MFSQLARGVGTLNGELRLEAWTDDEKDTGPLFPSIYTAEDPLIDHRHGITVSPRAKSAMFRAKSAAPLRTLHHEKQNGELSMPKTFITRKGALMLFTDHELNLTEKDHNYLMKNANKMLRNKYVEYCDKFGSLSRLTQSVLNFGDQDVVQDEDQSISDPGNKVFLGFYHGSEEKGVDLHSKPGGDINFYLRDIKSRAASAKPRWSAVDGIDGLRSVSGIESVDNLTLNDGQDGGADDTESYHSALPLSRAQSVSSVRSTRSVLSADKLTASLKSGSYLGRPSAQVHVPIPETEADEQPSTYSRTSFLQSDPRSRPASGKSRISSRRSQHGRSRPQSGSSRPASGRSRSHSKSSALGPNLVGSVSNIPEGISKLDGFQHDRELLLDPEEQEEEEHVGVKYVEVDYVNEHDGMPDGDMFDDAQSVSSSVLQEEEILLPDVPEIQEGELVAGLTDQSPRKSLTASRKASFSTPLRSRRSSHIASAAGDKAEDDVFSDNMVGAAKPGEALYQMSGVMLSGGSGTFSLGDAQADSVNEEDVVIETTQPRMLSHKDSIVSDTKTPQNETLEDLKGLRTSMTSVASSHSGMATERARTVLKEEGIINGDDTLYSSRGSVPQGSRPGSGHSGAGHSSAGRLSQTSRPGSAPLAETAHGSRPGSAVHTGSRPGSSRSFLPVGEEKPGTPAPPTSPAGSRPGSPRMKEEKLPSDPQLDKAPSNTLSSVSKKDVKNEADSNSIALNPSVDPVGMKVEVHTKPGPDSTEPDVKSSVQDKVIPTLQEKSKVPEKVPEPAKKTVQLKPATETTTATHTPKPKSALEPSPPAKPKAAKIEDKKVPVESKKGPSKVLDINQVATPAKKEKTTELKKAPPAKKRDLKSELDSLYKPMPEKKTVLKPSPKPPKPILPQKTPQQKEYEALQKEVGNLFTSVSKEAVDEDGVGLSPEELELQKQILEEKMVKAQAKVRDTDSPTDKGKKGTSKTKEKVTAKKGGAKKPQINAEEQKTLEEQREALRQAKRLEKQKRLEEAKQLEDKIKQKEEEKEIKLKEAQYAKQLLDEELRDREGEAKAALEAEEEAREMLAAARKQQKEERELRRKAEIERKKEAAAQRRADQKKREEAARQREVEMLMRISDAEEKKRIEEEERIRKEEAEEIEREQREEDERLAIKALEEEEEKIIELERQAEEEAMARLVEEREAAEQKQREMEEESRRLAEQEEMKRRQLEEDQRRLEEEATKREEEEAMRREEERQRLLELKRMEQEARDKMREEMEKRRALAIRRREVNLERRSNMQGLKNGQGLTKPWVFSYYLLWPRETYEKLMGGDPKKKKGFRSPPKKPKPAS